MGWFENQIEERRTGDQQALEDSFARVAGVVLGQRGAERASDARIVTKNAVDEILKAFHYQPVEPPETLQDADAQIDYCLRHYGLMRRPVELTEGGYRDAYGPMLGYLAEDSLPVALLPDRFHGYYYIEPKTREKVKLSQRTAVRLETEAVCFYRPLPQKKLGIDDLLLYMKRCTSLGAMTWMVCAALAVTLVGLLLPRLTRALTGPVTATFRPFAR